MAPELRRFRNHPSIVMWATSANFFGRSQDQDPLVIGRRGWIKDAGWQQTAAAGTEGIAVIKKHDPTRPVFTHQGAYVGDLHTVNCYLDLTPLQEREEWLSDWAAHGEMPFLPIEFGTPLHTTMMRGRNGFGEAIVSESLMTEFCAIYLGADAYAQETKAYRDRIVSSFEGGQRYRSWHGAQELDFAPAFQQLQALFIRNTWRSWRTWGLTGGMVPWSMAHGWGAGSPQYNEPVAVAFQPGRRGVYFDTVPKGMVRYVQPEGGWNVQPAAQTLMQVDGPTLAWIAGPPEAFTAKDHNCPAAGKVSKQLVLINDQRTEQPYQAHWEAEVGGKTVLSDQKSGTLGVAQTVFIPVEFAAPKVTVKADGLIRLRARIGDRDHEDTFAFRVFPSTSAAQAAAPLLAFDPEGATTAMLKRLGYRTAAWDGKPAPGKVLVIGRHAVDATAKQPGSVEPFVAAGGRVLIFGQDPEWLRRAMGLRVARHVCRRTDGAPSSDCYPCAGCGGFPAFGTKAAMIWGSN